MKNKRFKGKSIDIGGILYKIKYVNKRFTDTDKTIGIKGEIDYWNKIIYLDKNMESSEELMVVIHEICHGLVDTILPTTITVELEEELESFVTYFACMLTTSLRSANILKEK